jgi:hypothetical protein
MRRGAAAAPRTAACSSSRRRALRQSHSAGNPPTPAPRTRATRSARPAFSGSRSLRRPLSQEPDGERARRARTRSLNSIGTKLERLIDSKMSQVSWMRPTREADRRVRPARGTAREPRVPRLRRCAARPLATALRRPACPRAAPAPACPRTAPARAPRAASLAAATSAMRKQNALPARQRAPAVPCLLRACAPRLPAPRC